MFRAPATLLFELRTAYKGHLLGASSMPCAALATAAMQCMGARARGARTPDRRRGLGLAACSLRRRRRRRRHGKLKMHVYAEHLRESGLGTTAAAGLRLRTRRRNNSESGSRGHGRPRPVLSQLKPQAPASTHLPMQRPTGGHVAPTRRPVRPARAAVGDDTQAPAPEQVLLPAPCRLAPRLV